MKRTCFIVGAGEFTTRKLHINTDDLLIAADGGYQSLLRCGLHPQVVVGDMDSITQSVAGIPLLRFPVRKNDTDLSLALRLGIKAGYTSFRLYGASGGPREDHFLAALQLMGGYSEKGKDIRLVAPGFTMYTVTNASLLIPSKPGQTISVFSHSPQSLGVDLLGLSYEERNLTLSHNFPLGISNAAISTRVCIRVKKGTLLIYQAI